MIERALTIWQPWAWAILLPDEGHVEGSLRIPPKRVENRPWQPPRTIIGQRIALHTGRADTYDWDGAIRMHELFGIYPPPKDHLPARAIIGVATVLGCYDATDQRATDSWFAGPYGWVLADVVALPRPITPVRGALGLWRLQEATSAAIQRQLEETYHAAE